MKKRERRRPREEDDGVRARAVRSRSGSAGTGRRDRERAGRRVERAGDRSAIGPAQLEREAVLALLQVLDEVRHPRRDVALLAIQRPVHAMAVRLGTEASLRNAAYLQRALGGMVDTCVLDDSYHIVTVDRQRDLVVQRTVAFARSITDAPRRDAGAEVADIAHLFDRIA